MTSPRLEIDLGKIRHNAHTLASKLKKRGISVSGVTKAMLGAPQVAQALLEAGVASLADSRIENIQTMRAAGIKSPINLVRSPMLSQVAKTVKLATISMNSELDIIAALSAVATQHQRTHGVVLMVELGDLREGIMPADLDLFVGKTLGFPHIALRGIGTNLACRSGVVPSEANMGELSALADMLENRFGFRLDIVSGGNSSNLKWALSCDEVGRINNLRLGEAILLGCDPLDREAIDGLHTDTMTLVAEVIESKVKPGQPHGDIAQAAFGTPQMAKSHAGTICQTILALGHMDTDPSGIAAPADMVILGASSDHLVINAGKRLPIGTEVRLQPNYSALVRAMASPFVTKIFK